MEFSSVWYFSFCSVMSLVFLITGLHELDKAALPVPADDFKVLLSLLMCTLSSYAFLFRPPLEHAELNEGRKFQQFYKQLFYVLSPAFVLAQLLDGELYQSSPWIVMIAVCNSVRLTIAFGFALLVIAARFYDSKALGSFSTGFFGPLIMYPSHTLCSILFTNLYFLVEYTCTEFDLDKYSIFLEFLCHWCLSLLSLYSLSLYQTSHLDFQNFLAASDFMAYFRRKRKAIEAMVGLSGILVSQYFTRENSGALVWALLCFAVSWLAILAMTQPNTDLGVFNFLISASMEGAVNVFGFHVYTWLVFGIDLLLITARWNIDSISVQYTGTQEVVIREWKSLEQLHDSSYQGERFFCLMCVCNRDLFVGNYRKRKLKHLQRGGR